MRLELPNREVHSIYERTLILILRERALLSGRLAATIDGTELEATVASLGIKLQSEAREERLEYRWSWALFSAKQAGEVSVVALLQRCLMSHPESTAEPQLAPIYARLLPSTVDEQEVTGVERRSKSRDLQRVTGRLGLAPCCNQREDFFIIRKTSGPQL